MRPICVLYNGRLQPIGQFDTSWAAWLIIYRSEPSVSEDIKRHAETIISLMEAGF